MTKFNYRVLHGFHLVNISRVVVNINNVKTKKGLMIDDNQLSFTGLMLS